MSRGKITEFQSHVENSLIKGTRAKKLAASWWSDEFEMVPTAKSTSIYLTAHLLCCSRFKNNVNLAFDTSYVIFRHTL